MNILIKRFLLLGLFVVPTPLYGQDKSTTEAQDVCSIFESAIANSAALLSGDVLVRERLSFDSTNVDINGQPTGALMKKTSFSRIIFDESKGQFAHFANRIDNRTIFPEITESERIDFTGWCCDGKMQVVAKLSPNGQFNIKSRTEFGSDIELLRSERFPDFRGFWIYPGPAPQFGLLKNDKALKLMRSGKHFHSSKPLGSKLDIYFDSGIKVAVEGDEFLKIYTFDLDKLVVTKVRAVLISGGTQQEVASFKIAWNEINNVLVPTSGRIEKTQYMHVDVNSNQAGKIFQEFDFHWFSVNENIDSRLFSSDNVKNRSSVLSMIDPVKLNASSLIEKFDKKNSEQK